MSRHRHVDMQARKELLLARSTIERLEFASHLHQVQAAASPGRLLKTVWPKLASSGGVGSAMQAWRILRRYPFVSSAASMLLTRIRPRGIWRIAKLGGAALAAYQGYKLWSAIKQDRGSRADPR